MMKLLESLCGLVAISLVLMACADGELPTSTNHLGLQAAVVGLATVNVNDAFAEQVTPDGIVWVGIQDRQVDQGPGEPVPNKWTHFNLWLQDNRTGYSCHDGVDLSISDYTFSMEKVTVNVSTQCGDVDVTIWRTGPIQHVEWNYWDWNWGAENCSPPVGYSDHDVGVSISALATGSATIGAYTVTLDTRGFIRHRTASVIVCQ